MLHTLSCLKKKKKRKDSISFQRCCRVSTIWDMYLKLCSLRHFYVFNWERESRSKKAEAVAKSINKNVSPSMCNNNNSSHSTYQRPLTVNGCCLRFFSSQFCPKTTQQWIEMKRCVAKIIIIIYEYAQKKRKIYSGCSRDKDRAAGRESE